jgi:hypothetical protein
VSAAGERPPATASEPTPAAVAPAMRWLLYMAAVLVFLAGVQLFVFPLRTPRYFAWTIDSPMTAVFLGASYWSAVGLEVGAARAPRWAGARIAVPAVFVFTTLTLNVTLAHLDKFHLDGDLPLNTRAVTWAWLGVYALVPVLMVAAYIVQRSVSTAVPPPDRLPPVVRAVLVVLAAVLLGLGVALLVAPGWADAAWPWPLTPLTGRAIGAWLAGLGTAAAHARILDDRDSLRPLGITGVAFGVLQSVAQPVTRTLASLTARSRCERRQNDPGAARRLRHPSGGWRSSMAGSLPLSAEASFERESIPSLR